MKKENIKLNNSQNLVLVVLLLTFSFLAFPFIASAGTINKPPNNLNLTGYWSLNEGSGSIAGDASGNGRNGTLTNMNTAAAWVAGKRGKALLFDGSNDYVATDLAMNNFLSNATGTVSVWVKPTGSSQSATEAVNATRIFGGVNTNNFAPGISRGTVGGLDRIWAYNYAFGFYKVGVEYVNDAWTHIVLVHSLGTLYIYKNGVLGGSIASGDSTSIGGATVFGGSSTANYFSGTIDEVRTYSRSLSASEILALYQSGSAKIGLSNSSPGTLATGLTGHWTFDGKDMVSNVADVSGNERNGVLSGFTSTTTAPGKVGQALKFDGTDDYVDTNNTWDNFITTTDGTISAWIRPRGTAPNITMGTMYNSRKVVSVFDTFNTFGITRGNNTTFGGDMIWAYNIDTICGAAFDAVGVSYNTNEWTHVTWMHTGGTLYLYKNGDLATSTASGTTGGCSADNLVIGTGWSGGSNRFWNGDIDEVRTYNRALSASEIKQVYNLGAGQKVAKTSTPVGTLSDGLKGHWTFDGGDTNWNTNTVTDKSGNGNTGTLTNMSTSTSPVPGKIGQGLTFNGTNSAVGLGTSATIQPATHGFSVSLWYKGLRGTTESFISSGPTAGAYWDIQNGAAIFVTSGPSLSVSYSLPNNNDWHHLVVVLDRSTDSAAAYIDGVSQGSNTGDLSGYSVSGNGGANIGIGTWASGGYRQGPIDDVRIYNRVLSASEAKQLYLLGK